MLAISLEVPSRHTNRKKCVSNRLHGSHTTTATNWQAFITKCDTRSRHIRQWNLKKTKASNRSKLKENFIHIDCIEVQTMVENPLPAFSTTINFLRHNNDLADMKNHDFLSFSLSSLESKHSVVHNHDDNDSSTKDSCNSSREPLKMHLSCEQNFGLLPSVFETSTLQSQTDVLNFRIQPGCTLYTIEVTATQSWAKLDPIWSK